MRPINNPPPTVDLRSYAKPKNDNTPMRLLHPRSEKHIYDLKLLLLARFNVNSSRDGKWKNPYGGNSRISVGVPAPAANGVETIDSCRSSGVTASMATGQRERV